MEQQNQASSAQAKGRHSSKILSATAPDWPKVANILADAFSHDPVMRWMIASGAYDERFFGVELAGLYGAQQHVFFNEAGTGAAMWLPPNVSAEEPRSIKMLLILLRIVLGNGFAPLKRMQLLEQAFAKHHPQQPHYYLHTLGTRLANQGQGVGSALLRHGTRICDDQGFPAYLESSNERNVPLYINHGFRVIAEEALPENGPMVWYMWRDASFPMASTD